MYAYAGNNPVRYTDPDGRNVKNNTDDYIIVKLEDADEGTGIDFVVLKPGDTYKGKVDGVMDKDKNLYKVSAKKPFKINFTVNKDGTMKLGFFSKIINGLSDLIKKISNKNKPVSEQYLLSGVYKSDSQNGDPTEGYEKLYEDWGVDIEKVMDSPDTWAEKYDSQPKEIMEHIKSKKDANSE